MTRTSLHPAVLSLAGIVLTLILAGLMSIVVIQSTQAYLSIQSQQRYHPMENINFFAMIICSNLILVGFGVILIIKSLYDS